PFRDTFDSSFDDVVYVDYLSLATSKLVLSRRVIGLPIPFVCFCHCLSGGLARDLIRVCRDLLERAQTGEVPNEAALLFGALVAADLQSKLRGTSIIGRERGSEQ